MENTAHQHYTDADGHVACDRNICTPVELAMSELTAAAGRAMELAHSKTATPEEIATAEARLVAARTAVKVGQLFAATQAADERFQF
jgi:hypothetical protein